MATYSFSQLEQIWLSAAKGTKYSSKAWAALMAAIALAESAGNPDATNPTDNNGAQTSWGLWEISLGNHDEPSPDWSNPAVNAQLAIGKLSTQGLSAWGTYTSGAYKKFLNGAAIPSGTDLDSSGGQPGTGSVASVVNLPSDVTGFFSDADTFVNALMWFVNPGSWVRIGAFIIGVALLLFAIHAFIAVGSGTPIMPSVPTAIPVPV
jgi:hypothetical protein